MMSREVEKLTEYELLKRLDNEFSDVDFSVRDCATKGVVAMVYFYEDKFEGVNNDQNIQNKIPRYYDHLFTR